MAYITKEAVQKCLDDLSGENLIGSENDTFISLAEAKDRIEELPTADVVERSELKKIFEEIEALCEYYKYIYEGTYAPELKDALAELKKKYIKE